MLSKAAQGRRFVDLILERISVRIKMRKGVSVLPVDEQSGLDAWLSPQVRSLRRSHRINRWTRMSPRLLVQLISDGVKLTIFRARKCCQAPYWTAVDGHYS
jgi:hypothetical protein